jgi:Ran GTPase-activating protein (RanGAP) involved in mRNA processing and transport
MPEVRLTDTFRIGVGIEVPGADPSKRLRGEFVELTGEELQALRAELGEGGKFPDLSEENLEIRGNKSNEEEHDPLTEVVGDIIADRFRDAGFETLQEVKAASDEELEEVYGVGSATIDDIRDAEQ